MFFAINWDSRIQTGGYSSRVRITQLCLRRKIIIGEDVHHRKATASLRTSKLFSLVFLQILQFAGVLHVFVPSREVFRALSTIPITS